MTLIPRVTIGLPVYNGEKYLRESLDSLLAQTFEDFELIISDNASTDATAAICHQYLARDRRVRYLRQDRNIGAVPNHNLLVDHARGEYFKWAAHDDVYDPELLSLCVQALDERPDVVLSHGDMAIIDEVGRPVTNIDYTLATGSPDPIERYRSLLMADEGDDEYGVIRTDVLRKVRLFGSYHNPGRTFITELALHGPFHQVPKLLYYRRDHPERLDRQPSIRVECARQDPRRANQTVARLVAEYLVGFVTGVRRAPITAGQRRRCYGQLLSWMAHRFVQIRNRSIGERPAFGTAPPAEPKNVPS